MKDLFGQVLMINTWFDHDALVKTRQDYRRARPTKVGAEESSMQLLTEGRQKKIVKLLGTEQTPQMFFIDNSPRAELPYEEMVCRSKLMAILDHLSQLPGIKIKKMAIPKERSMMDVDDCLQSLLKRVAVSLESEKAQRLLRSTMQTEVTELNNKVVEIEQELGLIDDDSKTTIGRHVATGVLRKLVGHYL
ncbi:hypothetical protein B0T10DRAFT_569194 [Thelonectria olida]|uniref:Uncharacterized protein n=1 Tax=Thelonectria olida TaxID=1576542 RepID=A0A9P8VRI3_9HYPO|nr:hypothetical protein B0T10DRAFT_569194 [Thelonectria olida]